ncbi:MAG: sugar ABC transporter ATP-binding protein, partial [Candidatus Eremiobacteraeota bacterium]|nr:sugar ABC transporter ATP-binding protein [Candidatus Eremiobacteraeota bacterium]
MPTTEAAAPPYLVLRGISKSYPGVRALDGVDFDVRAGEVHALVGENGAGKSTLVNILSGAVRADAGTIDVQGRTVAIASPRQSEALGIAVIHQEFNLVPQLSAAANIELGHEPVRGIAIDERELHVRAAAALSRLGVDVPLDAPVRTLSVAQQQMIEIAKALAVEARLIFMDEPSAALTGKEVDRLFDIIRTLTAHGVGVVYISHRLEEVFAIADRITVFRDGRLIETRPRSDFTQDDVIRLMVGRALSAHFPALPPDPPRDVPLLSVRGLTTRGRIDGVTLDVYAGEIYGIAGLVGSGRTSLLRAICGVDRFDAGTVMLAGKPLSLHNPHDGIAAGLALVTEDRKTQGLILGMSVRENVTLPHLADFAPLGVIDEKKEMTAVATETAALHLRAHSIEQAVRSLSGGNQQKVVLAKWLLERATLICFDEPTRGIDVGAKAEIYDLMLSLAKSGTGIIMVSSELPEVLGMSMRIGVMCGGRLVHEFTRSEATPEA